MKFFSRKPEKRANTYTDQRIAEAQAMVSGGDIDTSRIGAVQAAAGMWARVFAVATVFPATGATAMLTTPILHDLGRSLVLQGDAVYLIAETAGGL